jgi:bisphosphoglycerate-dependent phosphoglycerate mutase
MPDPNNIDSNSSLDRNLIVKEPSQVQNQISESAIVVPPEEFDDDIITLAIKEDDLPDMVLKSVMLGLAEETQALKDARIRNQNASKDISNISMKRGTLLKYMSDTVIQRQALVGGSNEIDLKGPKFRAIIKMFLEIVDETITDVNIPIEYRDLFFHSLARKMDGWEMKAEKILKNVK